MGQWRVESQKGVMVLKRHGRATIWRNPVLIVPDFDEISRFDFFGKNQVEIAQDGCLVNVTMTSLDGPGDELGVHRDSGIYAGRGAVAPHLDD